MYKVCKSPGVGFHEGDVGIWKMVPCGWSSLAFLTRRGWEVEENVLSSIVTYGDVEQVDIETYEELVDLYPELPFVLMEG